MPVHDWRRGDDSMYHSFQLGWTVDFAARLNQGILPSSHFALTDTIELRPPIAFREMKEPEKSFDDPGLEGEVRDVTERDPWFRPVLDWSKRQFACMAVTIRHCDHHQPVAAVMWTTAQDKKVSYRFRSFVRTAVAAITHGIHLLVVDLFPPTPRDPKGIQKAICDEFEEMAFELPPGEPLTVGAYLGGDIPTAYIECVGVGDVLPRLPIFLSETRYVNAPLESTYMQAWEVYPAFLKEIMEESSAEPM